MLSIGQNENTEGRDGSLQSEEKGWIVRREGQHLKFPGWKILLGLALIIITGTFLSILSKAIWKNHDPGRHQTLPPRIPDRRRFWEGGR